MTGENIQKHITHTGCRRRSSKQVYEPAKGLVFSWYVPAGQRRGVLDKNAATQHRRVRPSWTVSYGILPQRLKSLSAFLGHDEFGFVRQKKQHRAGVYDGGVF